MRSGRILLPMAVLGVIALMLGLPACWSPLRRPDPESVGVSLRIDRGPRRHLRWDLNARQRHFIEARASVELVFEPCKPSRLQFAAADGRLDRLVHRCPQHMRPRPKEPSQQ